MTLLSILFPIAMGFALLLSRTVNRRRRELWVIGTCAVTALLAVLAVGLTYGEPFTLLRFTDRLQLVLRPDGLGSIFAVMVSVLWVIASFYALEYMKHEGAETRFFGFFLMSFGVTLGVAFAGNLLTMYLFYELLTLVTLPLVMHAMNGRARYAGKSYIIYSMTGAALGFVTMVFAMYYGGGDFLMGGSLQAEAVQGGRNVLLGFYVVGFFGFGVKAAIFPFHGWLLDASVAPTPVTALLHAVAVVKSGVFAVMRLTYFVFGAELLFGTWAQTLVLGVAAFTIAYASVRALRTPHFKRRLAYSTVANLSYILVGIAAMSPAGLVAAVAHMLFHAVAKICLFFTCGSVYYRTGKEYVYELEGFGQVMPATMGAFTLTALSLMGLPPLCGFTGKWLLGTALMETGLPIGWIGAGALVFSAFFSCMYLLGILLIAYVPRAKFEHTHAENMDPNWLMKGPFAVLCLGCVALSFWANPLIQLIERLLY